MIYLIEQNQYLLDQSSDLNSGPHTVQRFSIECLKTDLRKSASRASNFICSLCKSDLLR